MLQDTCVLELNLDTVKLGLKNNCSQLSILKRDVITWPDRLRQVFVVNLNAGVSACTGMVTIGADRCRFAHLEADSFGRLRRLAAPDLSSSHVEDKGTGLVRSQLSRLKESANHASIILRNTFRFNHSYALTIIQMSARALRVKIVVYLK